MLLALISFNLLTSVNSRFCKNSRANSAYLGLLSFYNYGRSTLKERWTKFESKKQIK